MKLFHLLTAFVTLLVLPTVAWAQNYPNPMGGYNAAYVSTSPSYGDLLPPAAPMMPAANAYAQSLPEGYAPVPVQQLGQQLPQMVPATPMLPPVRVATSDSHPVVVDNSSDLSTLIPTSLPGYELRVMDVTKRVSFDIGGTAVSAEVPIFVYMPKGSVFAADNARELRKLYNDLILIYDQERVDKERIRSMLKRMDTIIDSLDSSTPSTTRRSVPSL
jgi:hypothetical protein